MPKEECHFCTLFLCKDNLCKTEEYRKQDHRKCFIQIIGSRKPIECGRRCKIRQNPREWEEKYNKLIHEFQIAEGYLPCFRLGEERCNKIGS